MTVKFKHLSHIATICLLSMSSAQFTSASGDKPQVKCVLGGAGVAGAVVHLDPATGRPTSLPTPEQSRAMAAIQASSANRSSEGLVQEAGPTGGVMVNLRDRFRSPVIAVAGEGGKAHTGHVQCEPAGEDS